MICFSDRILVVSMAVKGHAVLNTLVLRKLSSNRVDCGRIAGIKSTGRVVQLHSANGLKHRTFQNTKLFLSLSEHPLCLCVLFKGEVCNLCATVWLQKWYLHPKHCPLSSIVHQTGTPIPNSNWPRGWQVGTPNKQSKNATEPVFTAVFLKRLQVVDHFKKWKEKSGPPNLI